MITKHTRTGLSRCRDALRCSRTLCESPKAVQNCLQSRKFHASRPSLIINEALQFSSEAFYYVHSTTGLSWGLSIPLTAALCQLGFSPLHFLIEKNQKLRTDCANLLIAWREIYRRQVLRKMESRTEISDAMEAEYEVRRKLMAKEKQFQKEMGFRGRWFGWTSLTYIPIWISNLAALRRMCGITKQSTEDPILASDASGIVYEPALASDGMLWFADLTTADPTWLLPITAWGLMGLSIKQIGMKRTGPPTFLQKMIQVMILMFGPLLITQEVSSAVVLAIIGSVSTGILRREVLDRLIGHVNPIKPARPRVPQLKKEFQV